MGPPGRPAGSDHRRRHRQSRAREAGVSGVSGALPQEPAVPWHPLRESLGTGHHSASRVASVHQRPEAPCRGGPRHGHRQSAPLAAAGDRPRHRSGADPSSRPRSPAGADAVRGGARPRRARGRAARARGAPAGVCQAVGDHPQRAGEGVHRARDVPRRARPADGSVRRGSRHLRQRLAEQRRCGAGRQSLRGSEGIFATRPRATAEKYFWKNSIAAYKWVKRDPSQPSL